MRNKFDMQLEALHNDLIVMGALCETAIASAVKAMTAGDMALAQKAREVEQDIDQKEREIENLCYKLLLSQQPVARDLRVVSAALKMITDMERIGDQAADIAEIVRFSDMRNSPCIKPLTDMAEAAIGMVTESLNAFVALDLELARDVLKKDDIVDNLFIYIREALVQQIIDGTATAAAAMDSIMVAKYLERIGDHAVNIAEWVEFSLTGRHKGELL